MNEDIDKPLFESLQKEFCPTLDSSLVAALLIDIESDIDGNPTKPTSEQINKLVVTLKALSLHAEEEYSDSDFTSSHQDEMVSSWTTSFSVDDQPGAMENSQTASSRLEFLETVLPHISSVKLKQALDTANDNTDLWDIIAVILTEESIREMEERGLAANEGEKEFDAAEDYQSWKTVEKKKRPKSSTANRPKSNKLVLTDVRQQNHERESKQNRSKNGSVVDPWTQISSIATRLSSLLPPHLPSAFSSFLHSPQYSTSHAAARASLNSLCKPSNDLTDQQTTVLTNLLDILMPEDDDFDVGLRSRIISDVELAVHATEGRPDDALDLASLLRDLDGQIGLGVKPPPPSFKSLKPGTNGNTSFKSSFPTGRSVPQRRKAANGVNGLPEENVKDEDVSQSRLRMRRVRVMRDQALMNAAIMYQRGNKKNRGGEVALYYAERAREMERIAKKEALNVARLSVLAKSGEPNVIDLHGTTVAEALVIVREILEEKADSITEARPLRIVTGKGTHSVGRVSVLKPAIRNALVEDGWSVTTWDTGLTVCHRQV